MRIVAIIQARMGSSRLPGKVLMDMVGKPMLWHIVQRIRSVTDIAEVVVATSNEKTDDPIRDFCQYEQIEAFSGSEQDVLDRFYNTAVRYKGDPLIRITADCPFVDPLILEKLIKLYISSGYEHVSVATGAGAVFSEKGRFPDGLDAECFSFHVLENAWKTATEKSDREHVTPFIWRNTKREMLFPEQDFSSLRWTVDNNEDLIFSRSVYEGLYSPSKHFTMSDILHFLKTHKNLTKINDKFIGREGYLKFWQLGEQK